MSTGNGTSATENVLAAMRVILDELDRHRLTRRAELSDGLIRGLYAAGAAYAAALAGPGESAEHKAQITHDANIIFDRQLVKIREESGGR